METNGYFDDIKELFRQTERHMQETDRELKETGRLLREMGAETDRRMQETDRRLRNLGKQIGGLGNRLGEFVEGMVRPALVEMFTRRGIAVHQTHGDLEVKREGEAAQIDLLVVNDDDVIVVEVKSKLAIRDVKEHVQRMKKFRRLFPKFADARLLGALAAMVVPHDAGQYAMKQGFFVIGQTGETAALLNDDAFEPKAF